MKFIKYFIFPLCSVIFSQFSHAYTVEWLDWMGTPHKQYINAVPNVQPYTFNINASDMVKNCGGGQITFTLTPDTSEEGHVFINSISGERWTFNVNPPIMPTSSPIKIIGNSSWCGNVTIEIQNVGDYLYTPYPNSSCQLATTAQTAICKKGCSQCIALQK